MKIIKTILAFIAALLMLSSCAVKQNDFSDSNSELSDIIGQTAVMDEAYKELTKDTNTITVDGAFSVGMTPVLIDISSDIPSEYRTDGVREYMTVNHWNELTEYLKTHF